MTNITVLPPQDEFETYLTQQLTNTESSWIYVNSVPSYTPSTTKAYLVINPWKVNMEIIKVNNYNWSNKTFAIETRAISKSLWVSATAQTHWQWSKVIISDNFMFWYNIQTAVNSKIDGNTQWIPFYNNVSHRDNQIPNPTNGLIVWLTSEWKLTYYLWWRIDIWTGWTFVNATIGSAGKWEVASTGMSLDWTDTGISWATTWVRPSDIAKNEQSWTFIYADAWWTNSNYTVSLTPTPIAYTKGMKIRFKANMDSGEYPTLNVNGLWAKDIRTTYWSYLQKYWILTTEMVEVIYNWTSFIKENYTKIINDWVNWVYEVNMSNRLSWTLWGQSAPYTKYIELPIYAPKPFDPSIYQRVIVSWWFGVIIWSSPLGCVQWTFFSFNYNWLEVWCRSIYSNADTQNYAIMSGTREGWGAGHSGLHYIFWTNKSMSVELIQSQWIWNLAFMIYSPDSWNYGLSYLFNIKFYTI